jgi:hypothetical protein
MKLRLVLLPLALLSTGCASVDRFGTKLEMMAGRVYEGSKPEYEGTVREVESVGAMTALMFNDGKMYNVDVAHLQLKPGDTVRVYKTTRGYEARLWAESKPTDSGINGLLTSTEANQSVAGLPHK